MPPFASIGGLSAKSASLLRVSAPSASSRLLLIVQAVAVAASPPESHALYRVSCPVSRSRAVSEEKPYSSVTSGDGPSGCRVGTGGAGPFSNGTDHAQAWRS